MFDVNGYFAGMVFHSPRVHVVEQRINRYVSSHCILQGWIFALTLVRGVILSRRARRTLFDIMLRDGDYSLSAMALTHLLISDLSMQGPYTLREFPGALCEYERR